MLKRILGLTLSTLIILVTSFCVQKQKDLRDVSNTTSTNISNVVEPDVIPDASGNHLYIYGKVDPVEPMTTIQVRFQCSGSTKIKDWDTFNVAFYQGRSDVIDGSKVEVHFYPTAYIDFHDGSGDNDSQPLSKKIYNLRDVCSNWK